MQYFARQDSAWKAVSRCEMAAPGARLVNAGHRGYYRGGPLIV